jgi:predicted site-specific integrase-resolvase
MDQFQVRGAVIIKIEPGPLLVWIHDGYLEHFPSSNGIILFTAENAEKFFQIKKAQTKKIDAWI